MRWQVVASSLLASLRSAAFLSSFISSFWLIVCFVRTLIFARLFPRISHNFWDGPYGCVFAGCFMCGTSIWIENGRRRGEMALYVLPRALRASLPDKWVRSGNILTNMAERSVSSTIDYSLLILPTESLLSYLLLPFLLLPYINQTPFVDCRDGP
jgi:hypothetical protein